MKKLILPLLLIGFGAQAQQDFSAVVMKTTEITPRIYMLEGSGGNIGVFKGDETVFIIDDQFAPLTSKIKTAVAEITSKPIAFVVNTHYHGDHSGGNENLEADGAMIVAHENTRKKLEADQLAKMAEDKNAAAKLKGLPKITFSKSMNFNFSGEEIRMVYFGEAHTSGDILVHFVTSNVMHTGDIFVRYGFPYIDIASGGNINGMIANMDQIIALANNQTVIIPGHGQLAKKQDMIDFNNMLKTIRNRVQSGINAGLNLEQIKATNPTEGYPDSNRKDSFLEGIYGALGGK